MKKNILLLPLLILTSSLSSCFLFNDDDSWKEKYGNPELLIETVKSSRYTPMVYQYKDENEYIDDEYIVTDKILEQSPFLATKKKEKTSNRYFTYNAYVQSATSGPNYCNMYVYDDGYIIISHKRSLGRLQSVYFTFDKDKATTLVDFVFNLEIE